MGGIFTSDSKSNYSPITTTVTSNPINDQRIGASDNAIVAKSGNISVTSTNAPKEFFTALDSLVKGGFDTAVKLGQGAIDLAKGLNDTVKSQANINGDVLGRSLSTIGGLSETKISDGANITSSTTKVAFYVIAGIVAVVGLVWILKKKAS